VSVREKLVKKTKKVLSKRRALAQDKETRGHRPEGAGKTAGDLRRLPFFQGRRMIRID
jgi:hypothetical protein